MAASDQHAAQTAAKPPQTAHMGVGVEVLTWTDDGSVRVRFDDGCEAIYQRPWLRARCPCASCTGAHGNTPTTLVLPDPRGRPVLQGDYPRLVEGAFAVRGVDPMGHYGFRIAWGDGHQDGIYTWRLLRQAVDKAGQDDAGVVGAGG